MNTGIYSVYQNLVTELAELQAKRDEVDATTFVATMDALRHAAQVCANVAITEEDEDGNHTHTLADRELYKAHLQYR